MRWILDFDILLLVSGIARKHGIVPKPFSGHPQYPPPPKKSIFFLEQEISQEREFGASQIGDFKKMFLIMQTYLGGHLIIPPHFHLAPQIQCLPAQASASPPKSLTIQRSLLDKFKCDAAPSARQIT
jgi:hypothetical protein